MPKEEYPPVLTKKDFVRRFEKGEFGNRAPTWGGINTYLRSGYKGLIHIRNRIAGGPTWYNVNHAEAEATWYIACERVGGPSNLYISAMAPTEKTLIQGEVSRTPHGLYLFYSTEARPMREALKIDGREAKGVIARMHLTFYMNDRSYEWLETLMERYPDHVVEFSTYGVNWGTVRGHNTVFWEVRKYSILFLLTCLLGGLGIA